MVGPPPGEVGHQVDRAVHRNSVELLAVAEPERDRVRLLVLASTFPGAADDGPAFVDLLSTTYNARLKASAHWLAEKARAEPEGVFDTTLKSAIERWTRDALAR